MKSAREASRLQRERVRQADRRCDYQSCTRPVFSTTGLCAIHYRGRQRGHPSVTKALTQQEWAACFEIAQQHLKDNPPPEEVLNRLDNALKPESAPQPLREELSWWRMPENIYKTTIGKKPRDNSMTGVLATLLGVTLYATERDVSFPGESLEVARAVAVLRMRKRPKRGKNTVKEIGTAVRKLLWRRLNVAVGLYLQETVKEMIAAKLDAESQKVAFTPPPFSDTTYWVRLETPEMQIYRQGDDQFEILTGRLLEGYRERTPEDADVEVIRMPPKHVLKLPAPEMMEPYRFGRENSGRTHLDARPPRLSRPGERRPNVSGRRYSIAGEPDYNTGTLEINGQGV